MSRIYFVVATIPNGAALSNEINLAQGLNDAKTLSLTGIIMPAAWTAAGLGFQISEEEGGTYQAVYDSDNSLIELATVEVDRTYMVNPVATVGMPYLKLWSQTGGSGVNQGDDRNLTLILRDYS